MKKIKIYFFLIIVTAFSLKGWSQTTASTPTLVSGVEYEITSLAELLWIGENESSWVATSTISIMKSIDMSATQYRDHSDDNNSVFFVSSKSVKGFEWGYGYEEMNRTYATAIQNSTHELFIRFYIAPFSKKIQKIKKQL